MSFEVNENYIKVPRLTTTERNALTGADGMLVYDTTLNALYKFENGAWSGFSGGDSSEFQTKRIVVSASQTAVNDEAYTLVATSTFTDPTPVEAKCFTVFVRNGTATVGGTAYSVVGTIIKRTYHSGAWANYIYYKDSATVNIASASTTDLTPAANGTAHITGSTTIDSFGTLPAGVKINLVFDAAPIITNSANIICPGNVSINAAANDTAIIISEGGGVWRFLTYWKYDESYTSYTPSFTGFSVAPTITAGDWRWKMLTKNTFHLIGWGTASGTSNSTAMTVTAPFTLAWTGGSGFGLQQPPCVVVNNGAQVIGTVRSKTGGSNILDVFVAATGNFTASGNKNVFINAVFQMVI